MGVEEKVKHKLYGIAPKYQEMALRDLIHEMSNNFTLKRGEGLDKNLYWSNPFWGDSPVIIASIDLKEKKINATNPLFIHYAMKLSRRIRGKYNELWMPNCP